MTNSSTIISYLTQHARAHPERIALHCACRRFGLWWGGFDVAMSYRQLDQRSNAIAAGLRWYGIHQGQRVVVMIGPSPEFFLVIFALLKFGAIPILIDPGLPQRSLRQCLAEAEPSAFIGVALAHVVRLLMRWVPTVRRHVSVGRAKLGFGIRLAELEQVGMRSDLPEVGVQPEDIAAILFTSGSTGVPKGVMYRHRHLLSQASLLRQALQLPHDGISLPTFPPFALLDSMFGLVSVIPQMSPTRPARANARRLHEAMTSFSVTQFFGSPALMQVLAQAGSPLPSSVRRAICAGAPVSPSLVSQMQVLLHQDAMFFTPYGATECLPVSVIEGRDLQQTRIATESGAGTCVGTVVAPNVVRIIAIDPKPIAHWSLARELPVGEVGEITVAGPSVTDAYVNRPHATALAKIPETCPDGAVRIVHRMGDVGYLDPQGRLWFCGRKTQSVQTSQSLLHTEQVEPIFNCLMGIRRTALVGVNATNQLLPVLCYELLPRTNRHLHQSVLAQLRQRAQSFTHTADIQYFLRHRAFPVDIRHNAKINREQLAAWASKQLKGR